MAYCASPGGQPSQLRGAGLGPKWRRQQRSTHRLPVWIHEGLLEGRPPVTRRTRNGWQRLVDDRRDVYVIAVLTQSRERAFTKRIERPPSYRFIRRHGHRITTTITSTALTLWPHGKSATMRSNDFHANDFHVSLNVAGRNRLSLSNKEPFTVGLLPRPLRCRQSAG